MRTAAAKNALVTRPSLSRFEETIRLSIESALTLSLELIRGRHVRGSCLEEMEKISRYLTNRGRAISRKQPTFFILCIHGEKRKKKVSSHHEIFSFVRADTWNDDFPPILIPDQRIQRRLKKRERERESWRNCGSICRANDVRRSYCESTRFRLSFHRVFLSFDRYRPVSPFFSEAVIQFCIPASR